jgi:hypothetical protein
MTPEKRAKLLHYAADNPDARFISKRLNVNYGFEDTHTFDLEYLIYSLEFDDWEIYEEPKDEVSYDYVRVGRYKTLKVAKDFAMSYDDPTMVKITKSPNGEVKVEVVK